MTEERNKFFDGLSNKELAIRLGVISAKARVRDAKFSLNYVKHSKDEIRAILNRISWNKTIISILKKQLPQKLVFNNEPNYWCWVCPTCRYKILNLDGKLDPIRVYCPKCGQKLRR